MQPLQTVSPLDAKATLPGGDLGEVLSEEKRTDHFPPVPSPLAPRDDESLTAGDSMLQWLGIRKRRNHIEDLDAIATQESVFDGPLGRYYEPVSDHEARKAFDPSLRWTHREEKKVYRKVDFVIFGWVCVAFFAFNIDRYNLANATADNLLKDLKLTSADYNLGNTINKVAFLIAELPSQVIGKKLGVDRWIPLQMVIFSLLAGAQFWMDGRSSFLAFRFLIGLLQGGVIPDVVLYLSYYYTKNQLPVRLSIFWTMCYFASMAAGFLGVGILKMRGVLGYAGWRWMFLIEGIFTALIGIMSFFMLPPSPSETKAPWRPHGYFTDRQVGIIVNKVLRDDPGKGSMHNRQALSLGLLWKAIKDYDLWPLYLVGLMFSIPSIPVATYFQISMKESGFSTVKANLLAVPSSVITIMTVILSAILSELVDSRTWVSSLENVWFLPFFVALIALKHIHPWTYFVLATLLLGSPYVHPIQVAWCSRNSGNVHTRTVSASLYNMFVQVSWMIGSNLYVANEAPRYIKGNSIILGIIAFNLLIMYPGVYVYYRTRNSFKEKRWTSMDEKEQEHYLATTRDEGNKRLDFRFAY